MQKVFIIMMHMRILNSVLNRRLFVIFFLFLVCAAAFSFELKPHYTGLGIEVNNNSDKRIACGFNLQNNYLVADKVYAGTEVMFSSDFKEFNSFSLALTGGYIFNFSYKNKIFKPCAGGILGYQQIFKDQEIKHSALVGVEGRMQMNLINSGKNTVSFQPYVRFGCPFLWAAGLSCGVLFDEK